ncbi:MAG: polysaccharide deacetylase family protein [Patescibacteria group bacterium]|jgi:peptidoglycan/xylan/chitin deacetylase (PgdA/CDA1 family)
MFKKIFLIILGLSMVFSATMSAGLNVAKAVDNPNLILNPSLTIANSSGSAPVNWQTGQWGTNTPVFSYKTDPVTGAKSLLVQMSSFTSGDAKWYFDPVEVSPNTQYLYSDSYKSNVATDVVAQFIDQNGVESYQWLGTDPASSAWKQLGYNLTTPANVVKMSIFHLIAAVGSLETNNFVLQQNQPVLTPDAIPNGSLEQVSSLNSALPADWQNSSWGTNKATFSYLNTGHTGTHSVAVTLANRTSGAAEWYYTPQPVTSGQNYKFSDYYISNVVTEVDLMINKTDGSTQYITLATVGAASAWALFSTTFVMPSGVQTASIMHLIYNNGTLKTDDYSLSPYVPQKFSRPIISLTFDDSLVSYSTTALPLMNQYSYKSTAYIITGSVGDTQDGYMTLAQIKAAYAAGNEIGSHTVTHPDLDTLSLKKLANELSASKSYLQKNVGGMISDFAAPYGDANPNTILQIKKYYATNRSVDTGYNTPDNFNPYHILVQNMDNTTTLADVQGWVNYAQQNNAWLVLVYHQVDTSGDTYATTPGNFTNDLSIIHQSGIKVETINQALNEVSPQIK